MSRQSHNPILSLVFLLIPIFGNGTEAAAPPVTALAFAPDGNSVVIGSQAGLEIRSWSGLKHIRKFPSQLRNIHDVIFSPDRKQLAVAGGIPAEEGTIEVFSWPEGKPLLQRTDHEDLIFAAAWSPNSKLLATVGLDRKVSLFQSSGEKPARQFEGHSRGIKAVCFLSDGRSLATRLSSPATTGMCASSIRTLSRFCMTFLHWKAGLTASPFTPSEKNWPSAERTEKSNGL